ncbi:SMP-30/gluconolactonase/LRE family protein [Segetibacter sp. 3557_3]|uniref:SMP-30/gluconolactonase/LRE family protein n=1 Tax=Segetibacter sp. 3557_3 TaxID=2547429 RepID=UPI001A9F3381|nr:SMP-30/gluconolactonase/LRE family protein [Segetibacter sp. 3557_3]
MIAILALSLSDSGAQITGAEGLVAPGASLRLVSDSFKFTEGPTVDQQGNVFFTDQPNDKIWKYSADGKLSVFMEKTGRSNGMHFDRKGNLLSCADERNEVWSISPDKKVTVILKDLSGLRLNGPNDLWVQPNGSIYFTDPLYRRAYWGGEVSRVKGEKVYYMADQKSQPVVVDDTIKKPNGIVGTPDGKLLYVADIGAGKTYRYTVNKDGSLSNRTLFANLGSDGMTLDEKGNVYLTGNGVTIFDKEGKQVGHIKVPANWTANLCFAGKARKTLFITASESVFVLDMNVKGVE